MLPGISLACTGRTPPRPPPGASNERYSQSAKRLGRKRALLILRDMAFLQLDRFGQILRNNPGLTPRVLSRRLDQMEEEGLVERIERPDSVVYRLTDRGEDAVFILLAFLRYGIRHRLARAP